MQNLIILESHAKVKTIKKYLGKGYEVMASMGHIRDLPKSVFGVDVEHDFTPEYVDMPKKEEIIENLKKSAKKYDRIYLATDPDREGEAIAWHLADILGLSLEEENRIAFNEITKGSVLKGLENPRRVNLDLFNAQQARRILDRIVGYKLSPFLWKKVRKGLSAGRVQSVAVRIIVDRENEIKAFIPREYWTIDALLEDINSSIKFTAKFYGKDGKKIEISDGDTAKKILDSIDGKDFIVANVKESARKRTPAPPFTTSTLQQEASRKLGFQSSRTMRVAQQLYEGVDLKELGDMGLITYMRTDSLRISDEARTAAAEYINQRYGKDYLPAKPNVYKSRAGAQEAHEAIRPTEPSIIPLSVKDNLTADQYKVYKLVWERFIASQMANAMLDTKTVDIASGDYTFRASGYTIKHRGFLVLYEESKDEKEDKNTELPPLKKGEILKLHKVAPIQHFTEPPPRYTEASLIKALEEKGIGRPSTYSPTISTIIDRGYIERENKSLVPTALADVITQLMRKHFENIVDLAFTAKMEDSLDLVETGKQNWIEILRGFYTDFDVTLKKAEKNMEGERMKIPEEETDEICNKCGKPMVIKTGRFGKFMACTGFPECKNTFDIDKTGAKKTADTSNAGKDGNNGQGDGKNENQEEQEIKEKCEKCGKDMAMKTGRFGKFLACMGYPKCKFTKPVVGGTEGICPVCAGKIYARKSKKGKTYYSCENYSTCKFWIWDEPQKEKCPQCQATLFLKKGKQKKTYCAKEGCGYEAVSTE